MMADEIAGDEAPSEEAIQNPSVLRLCGRDQLRNESRGCAGGDRVRGPGSSPEEAI